MKAAMAIPMVIVSRGSIFDKLSALTQMAVSRVVSAATANMPFVGQLGVNAGFGYAMATDRKQFLTGFAISQGIAMAGSAVTRANDARTARMNSAATPPSAGVSKEAPNGGYPDQQLREGEDLMDSYKHNDATPDGGSRQRMNQLANEDGGIGAIPKTSGEAARDLLYGISHSVEKAANGMDEAANAGVHVAADISKTYKPVVENAASALAVSAPLLGPYGGVAEAGAGALSVTSMAMGGVIALDERTNSSYVEAVTSVATTAASYGASRYLNSRVILPAKGYWDEIARSVMAAKTEFSLWMATQAVKSYAK